MNKFSAAHLQRGSHAGAAHMTRGPHDTGAEESSWNASARPARSTDAEISFGKPAHGLPAITDSEKTSSFVFFFYRKTSARPARFH